MTSAAEPLTAEVKELLEGTWGVPVSNIYAVSEGFVAKGWGGSRQLYQPDDVVVMELVDDENRPVGPGVECSKVLVTHLHNHIQPLIRYEISDRVSWAEPPDGCAWEGQWLDPPQGRSDDVFRYGAEGEVVVHPHVFRSASPIPPYSAIRSTRRPLVRTSASSPLTPRRSTPPVCPTECQKACNEPASPTLP